MLSRKNPQTLFKSRIQEHIECAQIFAEQIEPLIPLMASSFFQTVKRGGTVFWCGNGGSAADAQHFAAELVGRFQHNRPAIASIALTTDTSVLTAVGNDFGFSEIFARQISALAKPNDLLVAISTSGNSENVLKAVQAARSLGVYTIALLGLNGGVIKEYCDLAVRVPSENTARIQELHVLLGHILCENLELELIKNQSTDIQLMVET